jgi:hypothetical protein
MIRRTPIKNRRTKPRRGQPTKAEKGVLREKRYGMAGGRCELRKHSKCTRERVLPKEGSVFDRAHLVHLQAKRVHGWDIENLRIGCYFCHMVYMHQNGGAEKVVPAKDRTA